MRLTYHGYFFFFFFFNDTATTEIYTLSLHDALPISAFDAGLAPVGGIAPGFFPRPTALWSARSEEHTSELQSLTNLVCRLLLEKKKKQTIAPAGNTRRVNNAQHTRAASGALSADVEN